MNNAVCLSLSSFSVIHTSCKCCVNSNTICDSVCVCVYLKEVAQWEQTLLNTVLFASSHARS